MGLLSSTFDTIHPIEMIFGAYNKLPLYVQLNLTRCYITRFHGNNSNIKNVASGRHFKFSDFI